MKYMYQLAIIFIITFLGEVMYKFIPLPIPASIYGMILMLICLKSKIIKIEQVKTAGNFILEVMPVMFIPAAVGLITVWKEISDIILPILIITILTTIIVMATTGIVTQFILRKDKNGEEGVHIE